MYGTHDRSQILILYTWVISVMIIINNNDNNLKEEDILCCVDENFKLMKNFILHLISSFRDIYLKIIKDLSI